MATDIKFMRQIHRDDIFGVREREREREREENLIFARDPKYVMMLSRSINDGRPYVRLVLYIILSAVHN